jgi:hypothetical protein
VGNSLKEDLAKPGYKSKHESTKRSAWLEWCSHGLPTSFEECSLGISMQTVSSIIWELHRTFPILLVGT